ncbi:hypothetical protein NW762_013421 [Fusarium torreyae]|uniref:Uncharacterized protein n=1 Tax=Fusarium torreyae TaxID=1237075 RepID=A0A9W8RM60_9HYPO|nr:hypothetical protein NW762_013421 [Fusarium torreyae]
MVKTSRTFLFTKYARQDYSVIYAQGTDPQVWDNLPDRFSTNPKVKELLERVKRDKATARSQSEYYHTFDLRN